MEKKAKLFVYVESEIPAKDDGWRATDIELGMEQKVQKLSWRVVDRPGEELLGWGSNNIVFTRRDQNQLVGELLTLADAMIGDKEQRDAWKKLIRSTILKWHDEKSNRYQIVGDEIAILSQ